MTNFGCDDSLRRGKQAWNSRNGAIPLTAISSLNSAMGTSARGFDFMMPAFAITTSSLRMSWEDCSWAMAFIGSVSTRASIFRTIKELSWPLGSLESVCAEELLGSRTTATTTLFGLARKKATRPLPMPSEELQRGI